MKCAQVADILRKQSPEKYALSWDNPGLLAGRWDREVKKIFIALDATDTIIEQAVQQSADMLITHHPLVFSAIKKINTDDFIGRRIIKLIQNDICLFAMHTNFDVKGMADFAAEYLKLSDIQVLDITNEENENIDGIGRVGKLPKQMTLGQCADYVKNCFGLENVKVFGDLCKVIDIAAISPGSGKGMSDFAVQKGAQVLITGDIDYHEGIDAIAKGISIIDAGHYGIEYIFVLFMKEYLEKNTDLEIIGEEFMNPFIIL